MSTTFVDPLPGATVAAGRVADNTTAAAARLGGIKAEHRRLVALQIAELSDDATVASAREAYAGRRSPLKAYVSSREGGVPSGGDAERLDRLLVAVKLARGEQEVPHHSDLGLMAVVLAWPSRLVQIQKHWALRSPGRALLLLRRLEPGIAVRLALNGRFALLAARPGAPLTTRAGRVRLAWTPWHPQAFYIRGPETGWFAARSWTQALSRAPKVAQHSRRGLAWSIGTFRCG